MIEGSSTRLEDIRREVDCPRFPHGDSDKRFLLTALDAANAENAILRTSFFIAPDETVVASVPGSILIDNKDGTRRRYFVATDDERNLKEQLDAVTAEFKNFHRSLCDRFGCEHDEVDWKRDQCSLEEWIAKKLDAAAWKRDRYKELAEICLMMLDDPRAASLDDQVPLSDARPVLLEPEPDSLG